METTFRIDLFVFLNARPPQPKASTKTKLETPNKKKEAIDHLGADSFLVSTDQEQMLVCQSGV